MAMKMNDRQMKQAMKKMGIKQTSVDGVIEVVIRTNDREIILKNAEVVCVEMPGSKNYQIAGDEQVRMLGEDGVEIKTYPEEDIELVMSQAGCDREKAIAALEATDGQPAEAIISIISE